MSHPVASASKARMVALCDTATTGRPPAAMPAAQRPMRVILELVRGVDPTLDCHVARGPCRQRPRLGDRYHRRHREDLTDPEAHPERAQDRHPEGERDEAHGDGKEGSHGGDYSRWTPICRASVRDTERPEGTSTTRGR